jgi:hypothetical protein
VMAYVARRRRKQANKTAWFSESLKRSKSEKPRAGILISIPINSGLGWYFSVWVKQTNITEISDFLC